MFEVGLIIDPPGRVNDVIKRVHFVHINEISLIQQYFILHYKYVIMHL